MAVAVYKQNSAIPDIIKTNIKGKQYKLKITYRGDSDVDMNIPSLPEKEKYNKNTAL